MKKLLLLLFLITGPVWAQTPEERLAEMGIELPEVRKPSANFVKWRQVGNLLFLAGEGSPEKGTLGKDLTTKEGYAAARNTGIRILATIKAATGDLDRVNQFVKVRGMVNSTPDFYEQPQVINGFSDLMFEIFGERGKHARAAVGHVSMPSNIAVEIEVVVELKEE